MALKFALAASVALATLLAASGAVVAQDDVSVRRIDVKKKLATFAVDPEDTGDIAEEPDFEILTPVDPEDTEVADEADEEQKLIRPLRADPEDTEVAEEEEDDVTEIVRPTKKQRVADVEEDEEEDEIVRPSKKRVADEDDDEIRIVRPSELSRVERTDELIEADQPIKKRKKVVEAEDDYEDVEVKWAKTKSYDEDDYTRDETYGRRYSTYRDYEEEDYAAGCEDEGYSTRRYSSY